MIKRQTESVIWKPVQLDDGVLHQAQSEGLVAFEECTDYGINTNFGGDKELNLRKKRKNRKRRSESQVQIIAPSKKGSTNLDNKNKEESFSKKDPVNDHNLNNSLAWINFGLAPELLHALADQNFMQPTEIQLLTLPAAILGKRDILGAAETGSGKTLAFGLPILNGILQEKSNSIDTKSSNLKVNNPLYALILTPTRELAIQIRNHLVTAAKYINMNVAVIVGGLAAVKQERILANGPEIVVATPGRLWELIENGNSHLSQIDDIRFLAIDETDRMLEKGHFEELHNLLERLNQDEDKRKRRQNFVFSATLTMVHDLPKHLKMKKPHLHEMKPEHKLKKIVDLLGVSNPKVVDITKGRGTSATLTECRISCTINEKDYYLYYFLQRHPGRTLIFCNSIGCVKRLANLLKMLNCAPLPLHASMHQRQRLKNLDRFRDDENAILIATDVAARGLDIPCVEHVIHYQTPRTSESYVHRSGRTARASRQGITVLLIDPSEIGNYVKLCKTLAKDQDLPTYPTDDKYFYGIKQRVNLARELDKLQLDVRKTNSETGWLQKAAKDMDMIVDDYSTKYNSKELEGTKKILKKKTAVLSSLLSTPIFPKGFSGIYPSTIELSKPTLPAVEIVRIEKEKCGKRKGRVVPLFKPKKNKVAK